MVEQEQIDLDERLQVGVDFQGDVEDVAGGQVGGQFGEVDPAVAVRVVQPEIGGGVDPAADPGLEDDQVHRRVRGDAAVQFELRLVPDEEPVQDEPRVLEPAGGERPEPGRVVPEREVGAGPDLPLPALRILLAEDSPDNCTITMAYLEDTPYRVEIAENGAIACEMFANGHYDLVLMDRQMPVMDGLTATRTMRAWELANGRPATPIIALTASALKGDREKCLAAGCTAFLTKPIKQDVLLQAIKERRRSAPSPAADDSGQMDAGGARVNAKFARHIPAYLQSCRQHVVTMLDALGRTDFKTMTDLGHRISGSGGMFGFETITNIGIALEDAAMISDGVASGKLVDALSRYLDSVEIVPSHPGD